MEKPLKIRLHILSPVHIGCDDVYEPTNFVIDEKSNRLIEFNPMDFVEKLTSNKRDEFSRICTNDNLLNIFKFIKQTYKPAIGGREVEIASELLTHYKKVLSLPTFDKDVVINKFIINRTAYNSQTNQPYIPGSSLKGALRTAYLSKLAKNGNIVDCWNKYLQGDELKTDRDKDFFIGKYKVAKELEKFLFKGEFETDPFRMVKVSDLLPVGEARTKIVYAVNKKKIKSDKPTKADGGPLQILEVIQNGEVFEGIINICQPLDKAGIKKPIIANELLQSINKFYSSIIEEENRILGNLIVDKRINDGFKSRLGQSVFLLRLGRHSGAEAVTIEGNRHIKIMQGRGQQPEFDDHATTIWLASETSKPNNNNELVPFGWAVMEVVN